MDQQQLRIFRKYLRDIEREVARSLKDQTTCCGVTMAQCHVLLEMGELGTPGIGTLAERLQLDSSTLSRTVDSLVKAGLLSRLDDPANRRRSILSLTDKGQAARESVDRMCDQFYLKLFSKIPVSRHGRLLEAVELLAGILAETRSEFAGGPAPCGSCRT
jgi:DNA-binding MarR family transcriptional regulator